MAKSVLARILVKNHVQLFDVVHKEQVPTEKYTILGQYWMVPVSSGGILQQYKPVIAATKPTLDSVNSVRVKDGVSGFIYVIALGDAATAQDFANKAAECCSDAPVVMPDVVVPKLYPEARGCKDAEGNFTYSYPVPLLEAGKQYKVYGSKNGVALAPDLYENSYGSLSAVGAALAANWGAHGSYMITGINTLVWTSASAETGVIVIVQA